MVIGTNLTYLQLLKNFIYELLSKKSTIDKESKKFYEYHSGLFEINIENIKARLYCKNKNGNIYKKILFETYSRRDGMTPYGYSKYIYDLNNNILLGPKKQNMLLYFDHYKFNYRDKFNIKFNVNHELNRFINLIKIPDCHIFNTFDFDIMIKIIRHKYIKNFSTQQININKFTPSDQLYFYYFLALMPDLVLEKIKGFIF